MPSPHATTKPRPPRRTTKVKAGATATAVATAVTLTAAGCSAASASGSGALTNPNIVVAAVPATGASGLYIAADEGLFSRAGLHVTIANTPSASAQLTIAHLFQGKVDVTLGQWTTAIALEAQGKPLRALASGNSGGHGLEQIVTGPGSAITSVSQLKGKTVAVNTPNGLSQEMTESALAPAGVAGNQVHWQPMPFQDMGAAVAQGHVAAAFMVEPYISEAEEKYGVSVLADPDEGATQNLPITGYFTTRAWFGSHQAAARAFVAALEQGETIAASDRAAVETALIRHLGIDRDTAAVMSLGTFPLGVNPVQLARVGDLMQTHGQLPPSVNVPAVVAELAK